MPDLPAADETWKTYTSRRIRHIKETCKVPKEWWTNRYMLKLISCEYRTDGKAVPRAGEGHGKTVRQLIAQVDGGLPISKVQASKLRSKLTKFKAQLKKTKKTVEKTTGVVAKYQKLLTTGEAKLRGLNVLIESINNKLKQKPDEDEKEQAWVMNASPHTYMGYGMASCFRQAVMTCVHHHLSEGWASFGTACKADVE